MNEYVITIKKSTWFDDNEQEHLKNHINSFFKDDFKCDTDSVFKDDFNQVTINTTKKREDVEKMVLIFNQGHNFDIEPLNRPASIAIELVLN